MVKKTTKKVSVQTAAKKLTAISKKQTKNQILTAIAEDTGLTKKDVAAVFASLGDLIQDISRSAGQVNSPSPIPASRSVA